MPRALAMHSSSLARSPNAAPRQRASRGRTSADLINVMTFEPKDEPQSVWVCGDVRVSAIRSVHVAGHASYRVETPAGSVVIGADASNDVVAPPLTSSTSAQVERLAKALT